MKGISLSVNLIVIIMIAILVLAAVAAFFLMSSDDSTTIISNSLALERGCGFLRANGCTETSKNMINTKTIPGFTVNGQPGKIIDACKNSLGASSNIVDACYNYCCSKS